MRDTITFKQLLRLILEAKDSVKSLEERKKALIDFILKRSWSSFIRSYQRDLDLYTKRIGGEKVRFATKYRGFKAENDSILAIYEDGTVLKLNWNRAEPFVDAVTSI